LARPEPDLAAAEVNGIVQGLAEGVVGVELQTIAVTLVQRDGQRVIDRLANRLIPYLLQDRRIYHGVLRATERIHSPCLPIVGLNRLLDMEAVIHEVAHLERQV